MSAENLETLIKYLKSHYHAFLIRQSIEDYNNTLDKIASSFDFEYQNKENLINVIFAFLRGEVDVFYSNKSNKFKGTFINTEGSKKDIIVYRPVFINLVKDRNIPVISNKVANRLLSNQVFVYSINPFIIEEYDSLLYKLEDIFNPRCM